MKYTKNITIDLVAWSNMQTETIDDFLDSVLKVWESRHKHNQIIQIKTTPRTDKKKK